MSSIFEAVAAVFRKREKEAAGDFDALVKAVAGDTPPDPEEIAVQLEQFRKTPAELEQAVTRRQKRREDAALLADVPLLEAEKAELNRKADEENARFEALVRPLREEHQRNIGTFVNRGWLIEAQIPKAQAAKVRLLDSYTGPLTAELDGNRERQRELNFEISKVEKNANRYEHEASFVKREVSETQVVREGGYVTGVIAESLGWDKMAELRSGSKDVSTLTADEMTTKTEAAKSCRARVVELRQQFDRLVAREAQILDEMLVP